MTLNKTTSLARRAFNLFLLFLSVYHFIVMVLFLLLKAPAFPVFLLGIVCPILIFFFYRLFSPRPHLPY